MTQLEDRLAGAPADPHAAAQAAAITAARALEEGLVDVAYARAESPLGALVLAASDRGLIRLAYVEAGADTVLEDIARRVSPRMLEAPARLDRARRELDEYFEGTRRTFELPIDWRVMRGFGQAVLRATARIPYGGAETYKSIAGQAGSPRAVRATGNALGANPMPVVIPCHRVVRTGGGLGGYTGGLDRKRFLLELEGASYG
jgi:methylated-DNA-[protein]-cysteine S-methyltransferase